MPVEGVDAWDEDKSPFITIAHIVAEPQPAWNEDRVQRIDDGMKFSPWNGVAGHQPLGSIMRLRKLAYEKSAAFRSQRNATAVTEPARCPLTLNCPGVGSVDCVKTTPGESSTNV